MAARKTPSKGGKPDKIMRDAINLELHQDLVVDVQVGSRTVKRKFRKDRLVARALVNAGIKGDVAAIREINERMDGKVEQQVRGPGKNGAFPIEDLTGATDEELATLESLLARILARRGS